MQKRLIGGVLVILMVAVLASTVSAQLGVGVKISGLLEPFIAYKMSERLMLEAGLPSVGLAGFFMVLAFNADVKLSFEPIEVAQVPLKPYLGAGIITIQLPVVRAWLFRPYGLAGVEYRLQDTPFSFFGELSLGLDLVPGGAIGARFEF